MPRWARALLAGLATACLPAHAHKASDAYLQLQLQGAQVVQRLDIALRDLDRDLVLDADDDGALTWGEVRGRWAQIETLAAEAVALHSGKQPCTAGPWAAPALDEHADGRYAVLVRRWSCPAPVLALRVSYGLFEHSDPSHRAIVRLVADDAAAGRTAVLAPGGAPHDFALATAAASSSQADFTTFVAEGVHHILIGFDHVLFLLALLLPALVERRGTPPRWEAAPALRPVLWEVLRVVTAFTVAHSITLVLATFGVLDPPSRWIESIIAASVVLAAVNNLVPMFARSRWRLTFAFGLVHGFGFAGALNELGLPPGAMALSLLAFNVGVELGQLAIVAVFVALAWKLRGTRVYRIGLLTGGSALIALLASVWFVQRAFDLQWP